MSENNFFEIKFKRYNMIKMSFFYLPKDAYYHIIVSDLDNEYYQVLDVEGGYWYKRPFYSLKYIFYLLSFDGNEIKFIDRSIFDIKNHNFLINLRTNDLNELRIWKNYLFSKEKEFGVKFNIIENINSTELEDVDDCIEISKEIYEDKLKNSNTPLREDYSSISIIKTLFNI